MITLKEYLETPEGMLESAKVSLYALFIYLGIDINVTGVLFALMMIDTLLGVIKVFTLKEQFTFRRLLWGFVTKISILTIPLTVALMAKGVSLDMKPFVVVVMDILIVAEAFSIFTNMLSIRSRQKIENRDFVTILITKLRDLMARIVDRLFGNLNQ